MDAEEREILQTLFAAMAKRLDNMVDIANGLEARYQGLSKDQMYLHLRQALTNGVENAKALADYIGVATSEDWK